MDKLEAKINGSGDIDAKNITAKVADVSIKGSGNIIIGRVIEESIEQHSRNGSIKILRRGNE